MKRIGYTKPIRIAATAMAAALMIVLALTAVGFNQLAGAKGHGPSTVTVPFTIKHQAEFKRDKPGAEGTVVKHMGIKVARRRIPPAKTEQQRRRSRTYMDGTVFSRILKQAEKRLSEHDAAGAGKLITPLLPLLSTSQRDTTILALNPYAEGIFQKAYILRPFSREESDGMMQELARSGLAILPGVRKAQGMDNATGHM